MSRTIKEMKPSYVVTIRESFWNFVKERLGTAKPTYEDEVIKTPIVKSLGLARQQTESKITASGIVYDTLAVTTGAEITLGVVALPADILDPALGSKVKGAFAYDKTSDVGKEFAFGYYLERSNGSKVYYWHPTCKLVPSDDKYEDKKDGNVDPNVEYKIQVIPTPDGLWRVRYDTEKVAEGTAVLKLEDFFAKPIFDEADEPAAV